MSRVAFLTDQHFDTGSRWDETLRIGEWCADTIDRLKVDAIALGGDMYERRPNPMEVKAVAEWVQRLANIAPVVGVYGNHDVPESLAPMNLLEARYPIRILDKPGIEYVETYGDEIQFQLLPWPRRSQLLAAAGEDASREDASALGYQALQNVLRGFGAVEHAGPRCFVGHVQLAGARVSTGQPLAPGGDFELGLGDLALSSANAYLLGHIHLGIGNEWTAGTSPVLYGGSFRRTAFGELEEKSIVVVDFQDPAQIERITIPTTPMVLLERWFDRDDGWTPELVPFGAEVRLRYHTPTDGRESARRLALEARDLLIAQGASLVKLDEVVTVEARARNVEVATAQTPEAKLQAYWESKRFDPGARRDPLLGKFAEVRGG